LISLLCSYCDLVESRMSVNIFVLYLQKDKDSELSFRWKHCSITQQPLQTPIVACGLGRLYSKDAVIEALLDRSTLPETARHIKSLKVKKLINIKLYN